MSNPTIEALNAAAEVFLALDAQSWPQNEADVFHGREGQCPVDYSRAQELVATELDRLMQTPTPPLPEEPLPGLLMSMAIRYDHGLGCRGYYDHPMFTTNGITHQQRLESALRTMRQLYEEVAGFGFYTPEREAAYAAMIEGNGPAWGGEPAKLNRTDSPIT